MKNKAAKKKRPPQNVPPTPHFSSRTQDYGLTSQNIRHGPSSGFTYSDAEQFRDDRAVNPNVRYVPGENNRDELDQWQDYDMRGRQDHPQQRPSRFRQRTDEDLLDFVHDVLSKHPDIDVSQIALSLDNGVVILRGLVETRRMKRLIEDVIIGLPGIHDVQNRIAIERQDPDRKRIAHSLT